MRVVTDDERRARLGVRHALAPSARVRTPEEATRAVVCLHATDPPSVHLSCWARSDVVGVKDVEQALYETRSPVRQQSMRETLFVFPRDLVPAVWGSAAARVAAVARRRFLRDVERSGSVADGGGAALLAAAEEAAVACLSDGVARSAAQVRAEVSQVAGYIAHGAGTAWAGKQAIAPLVLKQLSLDGVVARAANAGPWHTSRPTWTTTQAWWGSDVPDALGQRQGYAELVDRWLWSCGPGTVEDIAWWLGATKTIVRTALHDVSAVSVGLEDGAVGWLHADDNEPVAAPEPLGGAAAAARPTVMGWKNRSFFLGSRGPQVFDSAGNAGTTAWVDGHVVGAWVQDGDAVVQLRLLEEVTPAAQEALLTEARRLTEELAGQRVFAVYPSPAMQPGASNLPKSLKMADGPAAAICRCFNSGASPIPAGGSLARPGDRASRERAVVPSLDSFVLTGVDAAPDVADAVALHPQAR